MFIAATSPQDCAPAERDVSAQQPTFGSAGAAINLEARGYKHLVPPGPKPYSSNTITPESNFHPP